MSMDINNNYSNYVNSYANAATQKTRQNSLISKIEATQEDYIKKLQEKNPQIDITTGKPDRTAKTANYTGRTDVRISPQFLDKMMNDSQIAAKYENMLSKIPALDRCADSMIKSMTGSEVKYRQVWIDDEGNMGSMCITGPSEKQKKINAERKENKQKSFEEHIEKSREKVKEHTEQMEKMFEMKIRTSKNGELIFNHEDIQLLIQTIGSRNITENKTDSNRYFDKRI